MKNFVFNSLNYYAVIMYLAFAKLGTFPGTKIVDNCGLTVMVRQRSSFTAFQKHDQ